jgi:hypothetical protein
MKVYIGPYVDWIGPYQIAEKIFFWVNRTGVYAEDPPIYSRWDYRAQEKFGEWLNSINWLVDFCNRIHSKKQRKINIELDRYDTWSMDHTLALIIHPMLVQLRDTNHGFFCADREDVPSIPDNDDETLVEQRYNWIMEEMIWTFDQLKNDDDYDLFYTKENGWDMEAKLKYNERIRNGLRLFGKYYQNLWD